MSEWVVERKDCSDRAEQSCSGEEDNGTLHGWYYRHKALKNDAVEITRIIIITVF